MSQACSISAGKIYGLQLLFQNVVRLESVTA